MRMSTSRMVIYGIGAMLFSYIFIFSNSGILTRIVLSSKIKALQREIKNIQKNNSELELEIERLKDPDYIAETAYKLGLIKPGEKVFKFYVKESPVKPENTDFKRIFQNTFTKYRPYIIILITFVLVFMFIRIHKWRKNER